ncbi:MAG: NAD/NADP octopine/nopaline dehydrogenase family protein [Anaerovoracaceae bacterium]
MKKIAIIGAGNGGQALAGYFGMNDDYEVRIFDYFQEPIDVISKQGYIDLEGAITGRGPVKLASTDMGEVVNGADLIMVVNPSIYHKKIATEMAKYIVDDQIIFLHPSSVFGAFAFKKALEDAGCDKRVTIGESNTLLFAARLVENGKAHIGGKKDRLLVSAFPACNRDKLYDIIRPVIKEMEECESVLETSFDSTNAMVHPLPTIMNASWEESGNKFKYYWDGIGETVGNYIEAMDKERVAIGEKLGLTLGKDLFDIYMEYDIEYNAHGENVSKLLKNVEAYKDIYAANTPRIRYIYEDIPTGMVPFVAMGELLGMPVEKMKLVITLCEAMLGEDLTNCEYSRNLEKLGLGGMTAEQIVEYAKTGVK